jgi:CubicO group peptidase (beta-lactamase class C family)
MNRSFALIKGDIDNPIEALKFEEPAGGGVGEARALAKIYGVLATGGHELNLNPETMEQMIHHTDPPEDGPLDVVMGWKSLGSGAGYAKPDSSFNFGSDLAFGFSGSGGSFAYADPRYQIGYAYVMNKMDFYGMNDPRETALRKAMYQSIWRLEYQRSSMYKTKIRGTVKKEEIPL